MKVIIDIPKKDYNKMCKGELISTILVAIKNGTLIPDNATNGDVIMAMFPNAKISLLKSKHEKIKTKVAVEWNFKPLPNYYNLFYEDWWNAPYNKEVEE